MPGEGAGRAQGHPAGSVSKGHPCNHLTLTLKFSWRALLSPARTPRSVAVDRLAVRTRSALRAEARAACGVAGGLPAREKALSV